MALVIATKQPSIRCLMVSVAMPGKVQGAGPGESTIHRSPRPAANLSCTRSHLNLQVKSQSKWKVYNPIITSDTTNEVHRYRASFHICMVTMRSQGSQHKTHSEGLRGSHMPLLISTAPFGSYIYLSLQPAILHRSNIVGWTVLTCNTECTSTPSTVLRALSKALIADSDRQQLPLSELGFPKISKATSKQ